MIRVRNAQPAEFPAYEQTLVGAARNLGSVADLRTACDYWHQAVAQPPSDDLASQREARYLHASQTFEGMVKIDGLLDPETGSKLLEKLEASVPPPDGDRTASQRRADTLVDLVLGYSTAPTTSVLVHLDQDQQVPRFEAGRTNWGTVLPSGSVDRITCDAQIERIIHAPDSRILDHGRTVRTISPAMKRALTARDRHCRFPGCQRPPWWTEGHHIHHWRNGGPTSMANLILLCRRAVSHRETALRFGHRPKRTTTPWSTNTDSRSKDPAINPPSEDQTAPSWNGTHPHPSDRPSPVPTIWASISPVWPRVFGQVP